MDNWWGEVSCFCGLSFNWVRGGGYYDGRFFWYFGFGDDFGMVVEFFGFGWWFGGGFGGFSWLVVGVEVDCDVWGFWYCGWCEFRIGWCLVLNGGDVISNGVFVCC